jgi:hypothetical protein
MGVAVGSVMVAQRRICSALCMPNIDESARADWRRTEKR